MCLPVEMGALGIRSVVSFNQVLLGKWLWRYGHEDTHFWWRVISTKYGEGQGGWCTKVCRRTHGCGLWRSINEGWENFSKHLSFVVGEGTRIRFWHDRWIGDNTLKDLYSELYVCSVVKDACIFEVLWIPERGTVRKKISVPLRTYKGIRHQLKSSSLAPFCSFWNINALFVIQWTQIQIIPYAGQEL